jgi:DNA polymerase-3 subunit alpha
MNSYIPLHCHSMYSLLDGLSKPQKMAERCINIGATSCALTDHGTIGGSIKFYTEMNKRGIKPILGCELYICEKDPSIKEKDNKNLTHFLVLAKNLQGWRQLIKLVSETNRSDYFYQKPRISLKKLYDFCDGNIIGISGHLGSTISNKILESGESNIRLNTINETVSLVEEINYHFGKNNFFLESQLIDKEKLPIQEKITEIIRQIGKKTKIKVIATPDAHYCEKEDAEDQRILLCNNIKTTLIDINQKLINDENIPMGCFFNSNNYHIPSFEEMRDIHTEEELQNTHIVDQMCEKYNILSAPKLPNFICPESYNPDEYLRHLCRKGWKEKIENKISEDKENDYLNRIKYELDVLQGAGLSSYFLIIQDIIQYVKSQSWLPGPGRGSAAGCLVSYLLDITTIDPMEYGLLFDRFYNAGRNVDGYVSMPDIDVDVPITKREYIIQYIKDKYGEKNVSQMITFNTIKGRGALKDVLRVYGNIPFEEMNRITKNIPDEAKIADELQEMKDETGESSIIRWALENNSESLKEWCHINESGELEGPLAKRFEQAIRLEGTKSNQSRHAAGVAITASPLSELCPMVYDSKNDQLIAGMEMQDLELIGVIKFDILGVAMLDKIMTIKDILNSGVC